MLDINWDVSVVQIIFSYLVYLSSNELLVPAEVLRGHEVLHNVDQGPECILLMHEQQGNGSNPVETLQQNKYSYLLRYSKARGTSIGLSQVSPPK